MAKLGASKIIPYGKQTVDDLDKSAVLSVLDSDFLTQGDMVPEFEKGVASYCGALDAVAVNSATSALHLACLALDVGPNDYVWTSPISFVASSNAALYCGAQVDFVDIDSQSYNMSSFRLRQMLEIAQAENKLPKVVIPVHLCGQSAEMEEIKSLSIEYGFKIIEDASHAIGGSYKNRKVGSCQYSDITVFSFHPVKIITTGEGGMAVTNDKDLLARMRLIRSHGITRETSMLQRDNKPSWYYEQQMLGFNYRLTDICAALGTSQLKKIDEFVSVRNNIAKKYNELFSDVKVITPFVGEDCYSAFHLYVIRLDLFNDSAIRDTLFTQLRELNIGVNFHYYPIYKQPYYSSLRTEFSSCPNAEQYSENAMSIPIYPSLSEEEQIFVSNSIIELLEDYNIPL